MSVTDCNFISATVEEDLNGFATYMAVYELITNDRTDGAVTARTYSGLPTQGSPFATPYETDLTALLVGRKFNFRDDPATSARVWRAELKYVNDPAQLPKRDPEDPPALPWNEPPDIETYAAKDKEAYLFDLDGYIVASSAGEPYDPVQERDRTKYLLRISRNQQFADIGLYATYCDAINSDPFFGSDPYTMKVETPGATKRLWFGAIPYYHVVWEFAVNPYRWRKQLYDYGMSKLVGGELVTLADKSGRQLNAPRMLDGSGGVNAIGAGPVFIKPNSADLTRDYFKEYPELSFAPLNLPQTF